MTCNHIKQAKAKIFELTQSLANKDDKTMYDSIECVSADEIKEIANFFKENKKTSITESRKKFLGKAADKILSRATDKYIIDQAALNRHLGDIYKLLEQCDCYGEAQATLKVRSAEIKGLADNLDFTRLALEEEKKVGSELVKQQYRISGIPNSSSAHFQYNTDETQKLKNRINWLEEQVKTLKEENRGYELQVKEERLGRIIRRVGESNQTEIFNLRDRYERLIKSQTNYENGQDIRHDISRLESELLKKVGIDNVQEIRSCCKELADLKLKLEQEDSNRSSYIEVPNSKYYY